VDGDADRVLEMLLEKLRDCVMDAVMLIVGDTEAVLDAVGVVDGAVPASVKHSKLPAGQSDVPFAYAEHAKLL
jgi:hypothetical protein